MIFGVIRNLTIAAFVVLALVAIAANMKLPLGYRVFVVQSGSMEPSISVGSVVATRSTSDFVSPVPIHKFLPGDVITFAASKSIVSHRVIETSKVNGQFFYKTKGDANKEADKNLVAESSLIGKVSFVIPYLGRFINFAKSPIGYVLMVVIPSLYVILSEIWAVVSELKKTRLKVPNASVSLPLILIFAMSIYFVGGTAAYFSDTAQSTNNTFTAAESFGPPIAQTLVINEVLPDTGCTQGQTEAQWIEVYNGFSTSVNLKNFKIKDGNGAVIDLVQAASVTAPAGGFVLLAHSTAIFGSGKCYPDNGVTVANLGGQLDIDTEFLQLLDAANNVIDTVKWGSQTTGLDPSQNQSIERNPDGKDTETGTGFEPTDFVIRTTPQPGL